MANNRLLALAAILGFLSVALGAFAAHGLKDLLDDYSRGIWQTAVHYQIFHTLVLLYMTTLSNNVPRRLANIAVVSMVTGVIIFSGSLYLLALTGIKILGAVTPIGGVALLVGWGSLLLISLKVRSV